MQFFYDGQVRRYLAQTIRMLSGFKVQSGDGVEKPVPVVYGDLTRQVSSIIRDNSENKLPSVPRIAVYITDLQLDKSRLADATYVNKVNIRERQVGDDNSYTTLQGQNYTVERIMPTPYILQIRADIWSANTEQKLQLLEQILVLFNPSFEIQTTDNFVDWTSLTTVILDNIIFSSRSLPIGVDSDIDICSLDFETPIWLAPPSKIKKLGVIQTVIANIFDQTGNLNPDFISNKPQSAQYVTPGNYGVLVINNTAKLLSYGESISNVLEINQKYGLAIPWHKLLDQYGEFRAGTSQIYLSKPNGTEVVGTMSLDPSDEDVMVINWDKDTYPTNTIIEDRGTVDAIVDPQTYNPKGVSAGIRYLILDNIGSENNQSGPNAWKNADDSDFRANANDIIEWGGEYWNIVFNSKNFVVTDTDLIYITNMRTNIQYKWNGIEWTKSFEGEYRAGLWRISL
jgi:hypothetical protein